MEAAGEEVTAMTGIYQSVEQLIGGTPLLEVSRLTRAEGVQGRVLVKLEGWNPAGSVKDRVALAMILDAEERGVLRPGGVIIEPTSGNTGIGLACVGAVRGYRTIIVMPDSMSVERRQLMAAYGAELVLTPGALGMQGAVDRANQLARELPGAFVAGQFDNPANPRAHWEHTGPEIWADTQGQVDVFVAGVGTGGTLSGVGGYLKQCNPKVRVVAVEPAASPLLSGGQAGPHGIQGIGANFIPENLDRTVYDEVVQVADEAAYRMGRQLARQEGILAGVSSGAALWAALEVARRPEYAGKTVVALLPDSGSRYLSGPMFNP